MATEEEVIELDFELEPNIFLVSSVEKPSQNLGYLEKKILQRVRQHSEIEVGGWFATDGKRILELEHNLGDERGVSYSCLVRKLGYGFENGLDVFVDYHSHPNGILKPSEGDKKSYLHDMPFDGAIAIYHPKVVDDFSIFHAICSPKELRWIYGCRCQRIDEKALEAGKLSLKVDYIL